MRQLDRKLLRDFRNLRTQAIAVALVMACGLAMLVMSRSLILSLETARDSYYRDYRFGQVFAQLKRAPNSVAGEIAAIPGVNTVKTGIVLQATLDLPGLDRPAVGTIHSLPEQGEPVVNRLYLRQGRLLRGDEHPGEVLVGEAFAEANSLHPGDTLSAILYGRGQELQIAGVVLSPNYVFEAPPGAALPDNRSFGVFWMPYKELATASNLYDAFNDVVLTLDPGASEPAVIAELDRILEPYGGRGAYDRENHPSNSRVRDEIAGLRALSIGYPIVFLSVAAFMINAVMSRQITLQREQIAILKAFGFTNWQVGWHYFKFALVIVVAGTVLGSIAGMALGANLVDLYHLFFRFPRLEFLTAGGSLLGAGAVCAVAAIGGVWGAVRLAVRLPPAEAMRPEQPTRYRPALIERLPLARKLSVSFRMIPRSIERRPIRAVLTIAALALATGILVVPSAFRDGIDYVMDYQWDMIQRQTAFVGLVEPAGPGVLSDFKNLPGVVQAQPAHRAAVELRMGSRYRRIAIQGLPAETSLFRIIDSHEKEIVLPPEGIVLSEKLAEVLGVTAGDEVQVRFLEGKRTETRVRVAALAQDFAGTAAYMRLEALNRLIGEGDRLSGAYLAVADSGWSEFLAALKRTPRAGNVLIKEAIRESFRQTTAESMGLLQRMYLTFAVVVAFGIIYNSARISLSERQRELATLRVIGFTQGEVAVVLAGELIVLTLLAIPIGLLVGSGLTVLILQMVDNEFIRLPLILTPANYAFAVLVVTVASTASALLACRRLNRLDLVGALKAPE